MRQKSFADIWCRLETENSFSGYAFMHDKRDIAGNIYTAKTDISNQVQGAVVWYSFWGHPAGPTSEPGWMTALIGNVTDWQRNRWGLWIKADFGDLDPDFKRAISMLMDPVGPKLALTPSSRKDWVRFNARRSYQLDFFPILAFALYSPPGTGIKEPVKVQVQ